MAWGTRLCLLICGLTLVVFAGACRRPGRLIAEGRFHETESYLWVRTETELLFWEKGTDLAFRPLGPLVRVTSITETPAGVWFEASEGVYHWPRGSMDPPQRLPDLRHLEWLEEEGDTAVRISAGNGVFVWRPDRPAELTPAADEAPRLAQVAEASRPGFHRITPLRPSLVPFTNDPFIPSLGLEGDLYAAFETDEWLLVVTAKEVQHGCTSRREGHELAVFRRGSHEKLNQMRFPYGWIWSVHQDGERFWLTTGEGIVEMNAAQLRGSA